MGIFKAPQQPNPAAVAAEQARMNRDTAVAGQELSMVDQAGPYGSLTYSQIGTTPSGTPRYRATTTLSPEQERALGQERVIDERTNQIAIDQLGRVGAHLGTPFRLDTAAVEGRLMDLGRARLDPRFERERTALDAELVNRGIRPGTEAYARSMGTFNEGRNDAYNQLLLSGRQQAVSEAYAERNQPINEIGALLGLGQIQNPQFVQTPQAQVQGVDYAGLVNANANRASQAHGAMLGGLFGLGGAAVRAMGMPGMPK